MDDLKELTAVQKENIKAVIDDFTYSQIMSGGLVHPTNDYPKKVVPTVGRIVHYFPHSREFEGNDSSPLPAVIVRVWSDTCVNLKVFTDGLNDVWKTSVTKNPDGVVNVSGFWDWPAK